MSKALHITSLYRLGTAGNDDRNCTSLCHQNRDDTASNGEDNVRIESNEGGRGGAYQVHIVAGPALVELYVDPGGPAALAQLFAEGAHARLSFRTVRWKWHQHADARQPGGLRMRRQRQPNRRRTAKKCNECTPLHRLPD